MPGPPRLSVAELADGAADFPLLDGDGQPSVPLLAVDLSGLRDDEQSGVLLSRAAARAAGCPRLLAGLAPGPLPARAAQLLRALDLTFTAGPDPTFTAGGPSGLEGPGGPPGRECVPVPDPDAALAALAVAAGASPRAALVLRQVLRATEGLAVPQALDVESLAYSALLAGPEFRAWLAGRQDRPPPPLAAEPVLVRRYRCGVDECLRITLNRPERRNAYGRQLRDALTDALRVALFDQSIARVVLDGAGPCFSSGGDLAEFGTAPDLVTAHFVRTQAGAGLLLHALRDRAEARLHGPCVGAGVELPAFTATVTADPGTTFTLPEVGMGLIPGAGGTVSIPRRIGRWRTLCLALGGQPLAAATALAWGLVDRLTPPGP